MNSCVPTKPEANWFQIFDKINFSLDLKNLKLYGSQDVDYVFNLACIWRWVLLKIIRQNVCFQF